MGTPKTFPLALTAQQIQAALLSVNSKIDASKILQTLTDASATTDTVLSTRGLYDVIQVLNGNFSGLGALASLDAVGLATDKVTGALPISKGGTGGTTAASARSALGVLTQVEIQTLINNSLPTSTTVDLAGPDVTGTLPISKGGTGAASQGQARSNLGVESVLQSRERIAQNVCRSEGRTFAGFFEAGLTFNSLGDVGVDTAGNFYEYRGALPNTVAAGFNPAGVSDYVNLFESIAEFNEARAKAGVRGLTLKGRFQTGFTVEAVTDCGLNSDGSVWQYTGSVAALPLVVGVGTVPATPTFTEVVYNTGTGAQDIVRDSSEGFPAVSGIAESTTLIFRDTLKEYRLIGGVWVEDGNVGDELSVNAARYLTITQAKNDNGLSSGEIVILTDRQNARAVVSDTGTADEYGTIQLDSGKFLVVQHSGSVVNLGHMVSTGQSDSVGLEKAFRYLASLGDPGGEVHLPSIKRWVFDREVPLAQILFEEQGMTFPPVAAGAVLPNGEIARNVMFKLTGNRTQIKISPLLNGVFLRAGIYDRTTGFGQAHKIVVEDIEVIGAGAIGHTNITIMEGKQTVTADANKGTTNLTDTFLRCENVIPGSYVDKLDIRLCNTGVSCGWGFGFEYRSGSIQYCNIGISGETGFTNLSVPSKALEIELCGIGVYLFQTDDSVIDCINEANSLAFALYSCRFLDIGSWMEGNTRDILCDTINPAALNRHIRLNSSIGPENFESWGSLVGFYVQNSPVGSSWYFNVPAGGRLESIEFEAVDHDSVAEGIDLSGFQVIGAGFSLNNIVIKGRVTNQNIDTFGMTLPIERNRSSSSVSTTPVGGAVFRVKNQESFARFEVEGLKVASNQALQDMQTQTFKYTGVITREIDNNVIISLDTEASNVFNHTSTGSNVPITVETPGSTIISGLATATQDISLNFVTGTPVSDTSECFYTVRLISDQDSITVV